nr:hypothetical protein [Marinicella sp. W31]MDC2876166.1 hypothetical protein [Marinicella sp. W31]
MSDSIPYGTIVAFYGSGIPAGWQICDGTNGTPDLRDRFILGAESLDDQLGIASAKATGTGKDKTYSKTTATGVAQVKTSVSGTALDTSQLPNVTSKLTAGQQEVHTYMSFENRAKYKDASEGAYLLFGTTSTTAEAISDWNSSEVIFQASGGGQAHSHSATSSDSGHDHSVDVLGPYLLLVYIMKMAYDD